MKNQDVYQYLLTIANDASSPMLLPKQFKDCTMHALKKHFKEKSNIINYHLNALYKDKKIIKINTKPAYYIPIDCLKKFNILPSKFSFTSWTNFKQVYQITPLTNVIGARSSLKEAIHQGMAAIQYPNSGLPFLITGKTGTGKTYLVKKLFEYAKSKNLFDPSAQLIMFNCAEYANNPELLSSKLFGYKRGAFTGADTDQKGLIELSNNTMLFIDEVHRLSPENQEKLFYLMDEGKFKPLGENKNYKSVNTHLAFATTENEDILIDTFKRRIPILIHMPSLEERSYQEKKAFIYYFLQNEAIKTKHSFNITNNLFLYLSSHKFNGNVGQMENTIKYICANALLNENNTNSIVINSHCLPKNLYSNYQQNDNYHLTGNLTITSQTTLIDPELASLTQRLNKELIILSYFLKRFSDHKINSQNFINRCYQKIVNFISKEFQSPTSNLFDLSYLTPGFEKIRNILNHKYQIEITDQQFVEFTRIATIFSTLFKEQNNLYFDSGTHKLLARTFPISLNQTQTILNLIENELQTPILHPNKHTSLMSFFYFISIAHTIMENNRRQMSGVIICHGYSTASSISNTANIIIGKQIFHGIDMPLDTSFRSIIRRLQEYFTLHETKYGTIILIDIGHSQELHQALKFSVKGPIGIIDSVSTKLALDIGIKISNKETVANICHAINSTYLPTYSYSEPDRRKEQAIIISCETGIGTAKTLQKIFLEKLPSKMNVKLLTSDFKHLKTMQLNSTIFSRYNIVGIIGTSNPNLPNIPYIGLNNILDEHGRENLQKFFGKFLTTKEISKLNNELMSALSLKNLVNILSILNPEKTIILISHMIQEWEKTLKIEFPNTLKTTLYIHISCMLERVFVSERNNQNGLNTSSKFYKAHPIFSKTIQNGFFEFEHAYHLNINQQEYEYLHRIIKNHIPKFSF